MTHLPMGGWGSGATSGPSRRGHPRQSLWDAELAWPQACMPLFQAVTVSAGAPSGDPLPSATIPQGAPDQCPPGVLMTLESSRSPGKGGRVGVSQDFGIL